VGNWPKNSSMGKPSCRGVTESARAGVRVRADWSCECSGAAESPMARVTSGGCGQGRLHGTTEQSISAVHAGHPRKSGPSAWGGHDAGNLPWRVPATQRPQEDGIVPRRADLPQQKDAPAEQAASSPQAAPDGPPATDQPVLADHPAPGRGKASETVWLNCLNGMREVWGPNIPVLISNRLTQVSEVFRETTPHRSRSTPAQLQASRFTHGT
jgi:hypothetical protein